MQEGYERAASEGKGMGEPQWISLLVNREIKFHCLTAPTFVQNSRSAADGSLELGENSHHVFL